MSSTSERRCLGACTERGVASAAAEGNAWDEVISFRLISRQRIENCPVRLAR
jgi:hypothetical protein